MKYITGWCFLALVFFSGGFLFVVPFWAYEHGGVWWAAMAVLIGVALQCIALVTLGHLFSLVQKGITERIAARFDAVADACIAEGHLNEAARYRYSAKFVREIGAR